MSQFCGLIPNQKPLSVWEGVSYERGKGFSAWNMWGIVTQKNPIKSR